MYNAQETRKAILTAACHLFAQKGLQAVSVAEVAEAAGCSKGAFFYHFPTKAALIDTVFEACHRQLEDAAMEGVPEEPDIVSRFCIRCYNLTRFALEHPDETAVNTLYLTRADYQAANGSGYRASGLHFQHVNAMVEEGLAAGALKDMPPLLLGEIFYAIASVPYIYMQSDPEAFGNQRYWDDIYSTIRCAMAKGPSA